MRPTRDRAPRTAASRLSIGAPTAGPDSDTQALQRSVRQTASEDKELEHSASRRPLRRSVPARHQAPGRAPILRPRENAEALPPHTTQGPLRPPAHQHYATHKTASKVGRQGLLWEALSPSIVREPAQ